MTNRFLIALFFVLSGFAMDLTSNEIRSVIYANEVDSDLQADPSSLLENCLEEFLAKGGTLIRLDGDVDPFVFLKGDVVFPSCSGANNRSQTLWNLLRGYNESISVQIPHATRYGFDSFNGQVNWNRTQHNHDDDEFFKWAGVNKSPKFGSDLFNDWLSRTDASSDDLAMMTEFYNTHYYSPIVPDGARKIYITFAKNAHVHLYRLNQTNTSLENVYVLFYPVEDLIAKPLPEWQAPPRSIKAYQNLTLILEKYLNFDQL